MIIKQKRNELKQSGFGAIFYDEYTEESGGKYSFQEIVLAGLQDTLRVAHHQILSICYRKTK